MLRNDSVTPEVVREPDREQSLIVSTTTLDESLYNPTSAELAFLRDATGLDEKEVKKHILDIQKEAFQEYPYPCIRLFTFILLYMASRPAYDEVLRVGRERSDSLFLDVGCNMGTDVRKLAHDGYPAKNIHACDLNERFLQLGHKLYMDKESCEITFFPVDIFSLPVPMRLGETTLGLASSLEKYLNRVTHLYSGLFFHIFDEQAQEEVARRLAALLNRKPGSIIFGTHIGNVTAGVLRTSSSNIPWAHSPETFTSLWQKVFTEVEGEDFVRKHLKIEVVLRTESHFYKGSRAVSYLDWTIRIV